MRVAFLLNDAGLYGANLSLSNMIKSYGFKDCLVLSPSEGPFLSLLKEMGVSYKVVPFKFIEENGIDVIHSNNSWISIGFEIAKQKRIKHVWHLREMSDLHFYMRSFKPFEKLCEDFNN